VIGHRPQRMARQVLDHRVAISTSQWTRRARAPPRCRSSWSSGSPSHRRRRRAPAAESRCPAGVPTAQDAERLRSHLRMISSMACPRAARQPAPGELPRRENAALIVVKLLPLPHFSSASRCGGRGPALAVPAFAGPANCVAQAEILSRAVDFFAESTRMSVEDLWSLRAFRNYSQ